MTPFRDRCYTYYNERANSNRTVTRMIENHKLYFGMAVPEFDQFIHVGPEVVQAPPAQAPPAQAPPAAAPPAAAGDDNMEKEPLKDSQRFEVDKIRSWIFMILSCVGPGLVICLGLVSPKN